MRTSALYGTKIIGFFEIYVVYARTRGEGVESLRTGGKGGQFFAILCGHVMDDHLNGSSERIRLNFAFRDRLFQSKFFSVPVLQIAAKSIAILFINEIKKKHQPGRKIKQK